MCTNSEQVMITSAGDVVEIIVYKLDMMSCSWNLKNNRGKRKEKRKIHAALYKHFKKKQARVLFLRLVMPKL